MKKLRRPYFHYFAFFSLLVSVPLIGAYGDSNRMELNAKQKKTLSKWLANRTAGQPKRCISQYKSKEMKIISDQLLIFGSNANSKIIYLNRLSEGCKDAKKFAIVFRKATSGRLCKGDMATVTDLSLGQPRGGCKLNMFVPMQRAEN